MFGKLVGAGCALGVVGLAFVFWPSAHAQQFTGSASLPMITAPVVETNLVTLSGNTRPEANAANDGGRVADNLPMEHMMLQLRRPAAQEQALVALIDQFHDPKSPNFHRWLSAAEVGAQFGPRISRPSPAGSGSVDLPSIRSMQTEW